MLGSPCCASRRPVDHTGPGAVRAPVPLDGSSADSGRARSSNTRGGDRAAPPGDLWRAGPRGGTRHHGRTGVGCARRPGRDLQRAAAAERGSSGEESTCQIRPARRGARRPATRIRSRSSPSARSKQLIAPREDRLAVGEGERLGAPAERSVIGPHGRQLVVNERGDHRRRSPPAPGRATSCGPGRTLYRRGSGP
jgi:hypothetical protein